MSYNSHDYASSLKEKIALLDTTESPRIIFVGGSGVALGIDSPLIEKETGLHPINMGIYGALGLKFMLHELTDNLRPGDIVVLSPEHVVLQQPDYGDGFYLLEMLHSNPEQARAVLSLHTIVVMLRHSPSWLQAQAYKFYLALFFPHRTLTAADRMNTLEAFNNYGDVNTELAGEKHMTREAAYADAAGFISPVDSGVLADMKSFVQQSQARGIHVFYMPPSAPEEIVAANTALIAAQIEQIQNAIGTSTVLGTEDDFAFPYSMYLDAEHPNEAGKEARTQEMIRIITPLLPKLLKVSSN